MCNSVASYLRLRLVADTVPHSRFPVVEEPGPEQMVPSLNLCSLANKLLQLHILLVSVTVITLAVY